MSGGEKIMINGKVLYQKLSHRLEDKHVDSQFTPAGCHVRGYDVIEQSSL